MAKYTLAHADNEDVAAFLPLEALFNEDYSDSIRKMSLESEMKLDFTYLVNHLLGYFDEWVDSLDENLSHYDSKIIYQELHRSDNDLPKVDRNVKVSVPSTPFIPKEEKVELENVITYERKVSLPTMPVGLDENDASMVAQHLLELYPTLKRGQAEFYSRHCTLGKYYTIGMYKKENNCAYETARTSMDNLASLGFYKKENIRNKFVYTPNPLNRGE